MSKILIGELMYRFRRLRARYEPRVLMRFIWSFWDMSPAKTRRRKDPSLFSKEFICQGQEFAWQVISTLCRRMPRVMFFAREVLAMTNWPSLFEMNPFLYGCSLWAMRVLGSYWIPTPLRNNLCSSYNWRNSSLFGLPAEIRVNLWSKAMRCCAIGLRSPS